MTILGWLRSQRGSVDRAREAQTRDTLERIVRLTNPRLQFARRYRARLTPAVQATIEYVRCTVADLPPACDASPRSWGVDDYIRAFFASGDDLASTFSRSPDLRACFEADPSLQEVCCVLTMRVVERRTLGIALNGGVLQREVPQTTVSFDDHVVRICERSEAELRPQIERRAVDQLALTALAAATREQARRDVLAYEHALLLRRLHLLRGEGAGFTGLAGEAVSEHGQLAWLENELAVNEQNLTTVASGPEGLEYQLERLCAVLANPQKHFFITPRRLRLDRMNVLLDEHSAMPGAWLDLKIARIPMPDGSAESRSVVLVRFPRAALLPRSALVSDAGRMVR